MRSGASRFAGRRSLEQTEVVFKEMAQKIDKNAYYCVAQGDAEKALELVEDDQMSSGRRALVYLLPEETSRALDLLAGDFWVAWISPADSVFDPVRGTPQFERQLAAFHLSRIK
jgi:hypothetical protein